MAGKTITVGPVTIMRLLTNLSEARDELIDATLGYKPSERSKLENMIARLAVTLARGLEAEHEAVVRKEFDRLVKSYDEKFSWTNKHE